MNKSVLGMSVERPKVFTKKFVPWFALPVIVNLLPVVSAYYSVGPKGDNIILQILRLTCYPFLVFAIIIIIPLITICILFKPIRINALRVLMICLVWVIMAFISINIVYAVRYDSINNLLMRSERIIAAIQTYQSDQGCYPQELSDLVPEYLDARPTTNMGIYPRYEYFVGEEAIEYKGNPWVLIILPQDIVFGDRFMYFPLQNYDGKVYKVYSAYSSQYGWWTRVSREYGD